MHVQVESLKARFVKYAQIWSQSKDEVEDRYPSTPQQLELAAILRDDLRALGLAEVQLDQHGYVTATLPATPGCEGRPVVGLLAHYDTYPGVSGQGVKPIVWRYQGGDLVLPDDPDVVIKEKENPELARFLGEEIITADLDQKIMKPSVFFCVFLQAFNIF